MIIFIVIIAIVFIIVSSTVFKLHPLLALLFAAIFVGLMGGIPIDKLAYSLSKGFGDLMAKIGLMVILGCVIGSILDKSGAAIKVAEIVLNAFGKKHPTFAMSLIGAIVGIPVFCDSGFIILSKLNKIVAQKTNIPLATIAIGLSGGLFATHTLVPPTPGPLSAAGNLGLQNNIGLVILVGIIVAIPSLFLATWFANKYAKNVKNIDDSPVLEVDNQTQILPPAWKAFMPIVLPIFLITLASITKIINIDETYQNIFNFLGSPIISFLIAICLSLTLFNTQRSERLFECFKDGINHCGTTLVLVGAGGSFGEILNQTDLKVIATDWLVAHQASGIVFLVFAFCLAAFFKTAQGSTTSAMVLTSGILAPLIFNIGFDTPIEQTLVVMTIGSGAMVVSHANDAWFWVVSQFSGISQKDSFRTHTLLTGLQGVLSFVTVCFLYLVYDFIVK